MNVEPKNSAAVIVIDGDSGEVDPEILMIRRNPALKFMGGHYAFPGGRIDETEGSLHLTGATDPTEAKAIHAAAREVFEETGLLLAEGILPHADRLKETRRTMLAGAITFDDVLEQFGLTLNAERFVPAGIWITPLGSPIRFHSRYYLYVYSGERHDELIEGEIDRVEWMRPSRTRRMWREGEILVPAPVAYVLQQLALLPYPAVLAPLRRTTHVVPETPGRIEYRAGIYVLPLVTPTIPPATGTNCIVIGESEFYVIDPATPLEDEQQNLKNQLDHLLEHGGRIAAAILTHSHPDHTGAAEFVRQTYNVPIWSHEQTAAQVAFPVDRFLSHDEVIEVAGHPDWRLRCIHTPGHDPGHLCFLEETTRTLIAGDMIAEKGTIIISHDLGGDMTQYLDSLHRLLEYDYDLMLPAHGLAIGNPKAKVQQYIDHRLAREAKIKRALDSGLTDPMEILAYAYDDVPQNVWPLAEKSLQAHLTRLRSLAREQ